MDDELEEKMEAVDVRREGQHKQFGKSRGDCIRDQVRLQVDLLFCCCTHNDVDDAIRGGETLL